MIPTHEQVLELYPHPPFRVVIKSGTKLGLQPVFGFNDYKRNSALWVDLLAYYFLELDIFTDESLALHPFAMNYYDGVISFFAVCATLRDAENSTLELLYDTILQRMGALTQKQLQAEHSAIVDTIFVTFDSNIEGARVFRRKKA